MSDVYEGLTSAQYEDWEPEYDDGDLEEVEEGDGPVLFGPLTGFELYMLSKYAGPAKPVNPDEDGGYGTNSYFARSMITE